MFILAVQPQRITVWGQVFAGGVVVLALWSWIDHWTRPDRPSLPFLPAIGLFYMTFFGIPALLLGVIWPDGRPLLLYRYQPSLTSMPEPSVDRIDGSHMGAALLGMVCLMAVLRWVAPLLSPLPRAALRQGGDATAMLLTALVALAVHFMGLLLPAAYLPPGATLVSAPLGMIGLGMLWMLILRRRLLFPVAVIFIVMLPLRLIVGLSSGSLTQAFIILAFLAFLTAAIRWQLLLPIMVAAFALSLLYRPILGYRTVAWGPEAPVNATLAERISLLPKGLAKGWSWAGSPSGGWDVGGSGGTVREVLRRINQAAILAVVMEHTPSPVPYWDGESLRNLAVSFIPRVFWSSKPEERVGNQFGHRYGLIIDSEMNMSVNLPWITESYANFGWWGVVCVMGLAGLVLSIVDRLFNRVETDPELVLGAAILIPLANQESNLSLGFGALLQVSLMLYFFCLFCFWAFGRLRFRS